MPTELHILSATRDRQATRLDQDWPEQAQPEADAIVEAVTDADGADRWLLTGGEPTLRPDLLTLISRLSSHAKRPPDHVGHPTLGLRTDGLLLARPGIDAQLHAAGLGYVRIRLHCGRADAHDWLERLPGSSARVRSALDRCAAGPLQLEAEVVLTRPTAPYLLETTSLLLRHGAQAIHFRYLECIGPAKADYIALAPRLAQLQPALEASIRLALRHDVRATIVGVPLCGAPSYPECHTGPAQMPWALPAGLTRTPAPRAEVGCPACPGSPACSGASQDYTERFGWAELQSEGGPQARLQPVTPSPRPVSGPQVPTPPARAGRAPTTRLRSAIALSELGNLGGDPLAGRSCEGSDVANIELGPQTPTRVLRMRLVRAAQNGASTLRIVGASLQHPEAHELLREAQRLSFEQVEVSGDGRAFAEWSDTQLRHLRGLSLLTLLVPSDDEDALTSTVQRIERLARIKVQLSTTATHLDPTTLWTDQTGSPIQGRLEP
jgi:hypothetical protein